MKTLYADAISNLSMTDGVVRFELLNFTKVEGEKAELSANGRVAMSLPALLRTHQNINAAVERMVEQGLLKKTDAGA
jgi:hypothetical protein